MRRLVFLFVVLLASIATSHATTVINLCTGGAPAGCSGTWGFSYAADSGHGGGTITGSAVLLSGSALYGDWYRVRDNTCYNAGDCGWISIQNRAALTPAGITSMSPGDTDPIYHTTTDPKDLGGQHTWTDPYTVYYSISFDLTRFILPTVKFSWDWAADDRGIGVYLNGSAIANTATYDNMEAYEKIRSYTDVTLPVTHGVNTLSFAVNHADSYYDAVNVAKLKIEGETVPEPGCLFLIGGGIGLVAFMRRRAKKLPG